VLENAFGILIQKFQIYQRILQSLPENAENIIFTTFILHNYLRDQGLGLSDMGNSANVRSSLAKIPNQRGSAHQNACEEANLKNSLIVRLGLRCGSMKSCNARLTYNFQLSWMLS
jgi:hypothetical protein